MRYYTLNFAVKITIKGMAQQLELTINQANKLFFQSAGQTKKTVYSPLD